MSRRASTRERVKKALPEDEVDPEDYDTDDSEETIRRVMIPIADQPAEEIEEEVEENPR